MDTRLSSHLCGSVVAARRELFILHAEAEADSTFVHTYLVPRLGLAPRQLLMSSSLLPGQSVITAVEQALHTSRVIVLIVSPAFLRESWSVFGELLASHHAVYGGQLVPLLIADCELPLRLGIWVRLDFRAPDRYPAELARLRELLHPPPLALAPAVEERPEEPLEERPEEPLEERFEMRLEEGSGDRQELEFDRDEEHTMVMKSRGTQTYCVVGTQHFNIKISPWRVAAGLLVAVLTAFTVTRRHPEPSSAEWATEPAVTAVAAAGAVGMVAAAGAAGAVGAVDAVGAVGAVGAVVIPTHTHTHTPRQELRIRWRWRVRGCTQETRPLEVDLEGDPRERSFTIYVSYTLTRWIEL